ncbi:hypothetical protein [Caldimonas sp. KR1-144]|uniref:hypothetical protein n=1 Tax=Caldimonas sp. KR1-144 TaxID=3400911 RepID=UPI003C0367F3
MSSDLIHRLRDGQRGFVNFPDGFFETLFALAAIGVVALLGFLGWGIWWLIQHVRLV